MRPDKRLVGPAVEFVDLHTHLLPGVDDGPTKWEDATKALRKGASGGTILMVATPHGGDRGTWDEVGTLRRICNDLNGELEQEQVPLKLVLGMENPLELNIIEQIDRGLALTVNGSSYILVELPFSILPLYWEEVLFQLQLAGLRPIVAHPERQAQVQDNPDIIAGVVQRGVLCQITSGSIVGHFGPTARKTAETLLKAGHVHLIASDCHGPDGPRGPALLEGFRAASKLVGQTLALKMMSQVPRAIVEGAAIPA